MVFSLPGHDQWVQLPGPCRHPRDQETALASSHSLKCRNLLYECSEFEFDDLIYVALGRPDERPLKFWPALQMLLQPAYINFNFEPPECDLQNSWSPASRSHSFIGHQLWQLLTAQTLSVAPSPFLTYLWCPRKVDLLLL